MDLTKECPCGHPWSAHTTPKLPGFTYAHPCEVFRCACDVPGKAPRLRVADLATGDWLECTAKHAGHRASNHEETPVAAGSVWQVDAVEDDGALLNARMGMVTIVVTDRDLNPFFRRHGGR